MESERWSKSRSFFCLPREIRDLIYSYIIPIDRLFIFLIFDDKPDNRPDDDCNDDSSDHCTSNHFRFDRGYAFPLFETSIFRVCHMTYAECTHLWLGRGHFRLEMGEDLGPARRAQWLLSDAHIGRMGHCDLTLTMPRSQLRQFHLPGFWSIRYYLKHFVRVVEEGHSLRQTQIRVRDKSDHNRDYIIDSDCMPESFVEYLRNDVLLPLSGFHSAQSLTIQGDVVCLNWSSGFGTMFCRVNEGVFFHFMHMIDKLTRTPGTFKARAFPLELNEELASLSEMELPKPGSVYDVQVIARMGPVPIESVAMPKEGFRAYFDGEWYLRIS